MQSWPSAVTWFGVFPLQSGSVNLLAEDCRISVKVGWSSLLGCFSLDTNLITFMRGGEGGGGGSHRSEASSCLVQRSLNGLSLPIGLREGDEPQRSPCAVGRERSRGNGNMSPSKLTEYPSTKWFALLFSIKKWHVYCDEVLGIRGYYVLENDTLLGYQRKLRSRSNCWNGLSKRPPPPLNVGCLGTAWPVACSRTNWIGRK